MHVAPPARLIPAQVFPVIRKVEGDALTVSPPLGEALTFVTLKTWLAPGEKFRVEFEKS